jgi:hypothetical protein
MIEPSSYYSDAVLGKTAFTLGQFTVYVSTIIEAGGME